MMRPLLLAGLLLFAFTSHATNIGVVGLFPGKAVLVVDSGMPKTYSVGSSIAAGIKLIAADHSTATIEINGKRQTIALGEHVNRATPTGAARVTLQADGQGHFMAQGQINGATVRMLVDTGATLIALPRSDAVRLGIDYKKGQIGYSQTANGTKLVYRIKLDTVKLGDIELNQVDASIHEEGLSIALLGMSFLNRTEMRREGEQMTLTKRY
jgi:aspartyl protease family protein